LKHSVVSETVRFLDFCVLAWNCLFTPTFRGFWCIFLRNDVNYRPNPKRHLCAETRCFSQNAWKSIQRYDLCTWSRRKGQDSQKSHKGIIFYLVGEKPPLNWFAPKFV